MTAASPELVAALPAYEIGQELGRGGFGVVYAGRHRQLRRPVAIKELPPALAMEPEVRARFVAEARVLASLDHPHLVPVYDYVEREGLCLLVMEALPGGTVWDAFTMRGLRPAGACAVVMVTCAALHHAHTHGVLHRDVKPENILYSSEGTLKVTDFGIAKVIGAGDVLATTSGDIIGTPAYIAPEQAQGAEDLGPQADVYAAGVMLYELLSGQLPYSQEGGGFAIVYRHVFEDAIPLQQVAPNVPAPLADVVMCALARQRSVRYSSAEEFGVAIAQAAGDVYGTGWLDSTGVPLMAMGPILATAARTTAGDRGAGKSTGPPFNAIGPAQVAGGAPTAPPPGVPPPGDRATVGQPPTASPTLPSSVAASPQHGGSKSTVQQAPVRPTENLARAGMAVAPTDADAVVPVRQVLTLPRRPLRSMAGALAALAATVVLAGLGIGTTPDHAPPRGQVRVAGLDVAHADRITVDLSKPVAIDVGVLPAAAAGAKSAKLTLSVADVALPNSSTVALATRGNGRQGADLPAASDRYLVAGDAEAHLLLADAAGRTVYDAGFTLRPKGSGFVTVPGVGAVVLLLAVIAYAESLLRPLRRRGGRGIGATVGMALLGAVFGVVAVLISWTLRIAAPAPAGLALCAGVGAVTGVLLTLAAAGWGRRARAARIARLVKLRRATA